MSTLLWIAAGFIGGGILAWALVGNVAHRRQLASLRRQREARWKMDHADWAEW